MRRSFAFIQILLYVGIIASETGLSQSEECRAIADDKLVGNVYGTVTDLKTTEPIVGAEIFLLVQAVRSDSVGNVLLTNKGKIGEPDLASAVRSGKTDERGEFLINSVPTPFPFKDYTIFVQASGYNKFIISQARILPGAVMALKLVAMLEKGANESLMFDGNDKDAPIVYRDQEMRSLAVRSLPEPGAPNGPSDVTFTVFATREGLVGGTTANGHVIVSHDHFVALPSRRALNANDRTFDYQVRLSYNSRTVDAPVWDVGPWNIYDDHWNPESTREIYAHLHHGGQPGLSPGLPEAQAAYQQSYNQGWSGDRGGSNPQFVLNPAGIDLADGTFWDDLLMVNNGWVSVNYLWRPAIVVGDRVQASMNVNVRSTPGGSLVGTEPVGSSGTITGGPQGASYGGRFYLWWQVQWDDALSGWSIENALTKTSGLPIQLGSFNANVVSQNRVLLSWMTLSEVHNYGFEIQRKDGVQSDYQTIPHSFVPGYGTTNEPQHYSYIDSTVTIGVWYYRLKQIDLDGTVHYSDGIRVNTLTDAKEKEIPTVFWLAQNYPNPFNPSTTIRYALPQTSFVTLTVYNTLGQQVAQLVNEQQQAGYQDVAFRGDGLASGVYSYRLDAGSYTSVKKLLLLK